MRAWYMEWESAETHQVFVTYFSPMILWFWFRQKGRMLCHFGIVWSCMNSAQCRWSTKQNQLFFTVQISATLAEVEETMNERYLGLPAHVGISISQIFKYLKDRVWQRIQGWKERFLSWAGKEILIKAIAKAIPTFAMGCFDMTKPLYGQISTMICRYWWNQQEEKHKIQC